MSAEAVASGNLVVAQLSPFDQATVGKDVPKAMTLLVDTSASRALGFARYASNLRELVSSLASRYPGLRIDVVAFDQDTQVIYSGPATGFGATHVDAMLTRGAAGASDLSQALDKLDKPTERIAIITDGVVTAGSTGAELAAKVKGLAARQVARIDVVMVGGIRDEALATSLVTAGLPRTGAVLDLDQRLAEVASGLGERVLTDIDVQVAGATWVSPRVIRSARPNQRTMVYARFDKPMQTIDVKINHSQRTVVPITGTPALIERAVAAAEIVDLEATLERAKPDQVKAMRAELVKKAVAARVISSQTSMLVLESTDDYARYGIDRKTLADILVVGPTGVEQRNRKTIVALGKRRPQRQANETKEKFALKDTTDPAEALKTRERSYGQAGSSGSISSGASTGPGMLSMRRPISVADKDVAPSSPEPAREARLERSMGGVAGSASGGSVESWPPADSPPPLKGKLADIDRAIRRGKLDDALAKAQAWHDKEPGDVLALIGLGEALEAKKDIAQASRIYGSIIDLFPGRADLRRFAGERLERIGGSARSLAVDTYRRAVEERPDHMTGHRLLAYALLRNGQHAEAFAAILKGLEQRYPEDRFAGGIRVLTEDAGLIGAAYAAAQPDKKPEIIAALRKHKSSLATGASTRFIMYWETDANDVDFHIQDAQGGHAFYSNPQLESGGELYADITTGYGPECFTIPGRPKAGPYKLSINYYSQGPMGYGMGLLQIIKHDGKGKLEFQDRPYVIMADQAYVNLGTFR
jgi:Flp pilus assembly protein TadD